ncbi:MAG: tyrosine-protein phosphatase [Chloroflexi bacterium]|nr:tyrosine-protein phosphatase [Chloroflexota bacterium]
MEDQNSMNLIPPSAMTQIEGVTIPQELYWVLRDPAPLAGMRYPRPGFPWGALARSGFSRVVRLSSDGASYDPQPLEVAYSAELEDLLHGSSPPSPRHELRLIREAVAVVSEALARREGVVVHCAGGRGRTGTVLGATLVRLGFAPAEVVAHLDRVHKARGTSGWPESPWQADLLQRFVPNRPSRTASPALGLDR